MASEATGHSRADDPAALTRDWFERVWNRLEEGAIDELLAADGRLHGLDENDRALVGPDQFRAFYRQFRSGLSDIRVRIDDVLVDEDRCAARFLVSATHSGDAFGIPATNRRITFSGMCIVRWRGGRVVEGWNEFDAASVLRQIGQPSGARVKVAL